MLSIVIFSLDTFYTFSDLKARSSSMRKKYVLQQRRIIKAEVDRVVNLMNYEHSSREEQEKEILKEEVSAAYVLADSIYRENRKTRSTVAIKRMILDAFRPMMTERGAGSFFAFDLAGHKVLVDEEAVYKEPAVPDFHDVAKFVVRKGEGFYDFSREEPTAQKSAAKKFLYVKLFKPFGWIIGRGLYCDTISKQFDQFIKELVNKYRFGNEKSGYIFIYRLFNINGGNRFAIMYANPNRPDVVGKYLSDNYKDAEGKEFRKDMLRGLREQGEAYVRYWYKKFDNKNPSPKLSYFKLTSDKKYIVGAGVYLDDVDKDISYMKRELFRRNTEKFLIGIFIITGVMILFFIRIECFSRRLKKDLAQFLSFFNRAVTSDKPIDTAEIKFDEFKKLAESANLMLRDKITAGENLLKSEKKYKELFRLKNDILESAQGIIVYALDRNYCYIDFTKLHKEMMKTFRGVTIEIGRNKLSYIKSEEERMERKNYFDRALCGENLIFYEDYPGEKGTISFENRYSPIYDEEGHIIGLSAYIIDITELKRMQEDLEENRQRFEKLSSLTFEGIIIHRNGIILDVNESLLKISGYSRDELIGKNSIELFIPEEYQERGREEIYRDISKPYEIEIKRKDGSTFPAEIEGRNVKGRNEDFRVTAVRDITERKKIVEEYIKLSKLESLGVLAGGIAHDFNNILTGLFGNLELARMDVPAGYTAYKYLTRAQDALERATQLTRQLLTFAKGGEPVFMMIDIASVVKESVEFTLSGSAVRVHFSIPDEIWPVRADKGQLDQVITNLTLNAKQAMPDGGNIFVVLGNSIDDGGEYVRLCIRDEGCGIPPDLLKKIFDPFFTTKSTGNGLGLATVFSIIEKHGGRIEVESRVGIGTSFTVFIPAQRNLDERETVSPGTLLVIDDETVWDVLSVMLDSLGYNADFVRKREDALEKYTAALKRDAQYDAVIMDLAISGESGDREMVTEILEIDPYAKILVSGGYSVKVLLEDYRTYGFSGALVKPFKFEDLSKELRRVLGERDHSH